MIDLTKPGRIAKPIITSIYTADPSAVVGQNGRLYIYASHDMDPARGCDFMDRYHIFSTDDMVHFLDEGEILRSDDVEWGRPEGGFMWAPDCAFKNGKYWFYYPHPTSSRWNDTWEFGVAVSDSPNKGFHDIGYVRDKAGRGVGGDCMIDPCIFLDDGTPYLYFGGGAMPRGCVLEDDMITVRGEVLPMEGLEDFHEASWVFKRNGLYYMTYSDNLEGNNRLRYAVSKNPLGPWDYRGIYLAPTGCDTSHGSVTEYKGHWYAFYHNCVISGRGNLRSVCVDELFFEDDGSIRLVEQTDVPCSPVGPAPAPNPRAKTYPASGGIREGKLTLGEDGAVRGFENAGAFLRFSKVDGLNGGRTLLRIRYRNDTGRLARIRLIVNSTDWSLVNLVTPELATPTADGDATFTVPLKPGRTNTVDLVSFDGDVSIFSLATEPLD